MVDFPYQAAIRLYGIASANWYAIDGALAGSGVDPFDLEPRRFLAFVLNWALERVKQDQREMWLAQIYMPLPGMEDKVSAETVDEEMAMFRSLQGLGG